MTGIWRMLRWAIGVGLVCALAGQTLGEDKKPPAKEEPKKPAYESITDKDIATINNFDDFSVDNGFVGPVVKDLSHLDDERKKKLDELQDKMDAWEPGREKEVGQMVRNWIGLCTLQDVGHGEFEAELPYVIFERLKHDVPKEKLIKALTWIALKPDEGKVPIKAPDLGMEDEIEEGLVRERCVLYAVKLLGRVLGKLPLKEEK